MKRLRRIAQLCVMISPLVASAANFDRFCDTFAAEWMRAGPQAATALQYFSGAEQTVSSSIIPAIRRAQALLQDQWLRSTEDAGLWRFPDGDKAYAQALHRFTTTDDTPTQIHALGLKGNA